MVRGGRSDGTLRTYRISQVLSLTTLCGGVRAAARVQPARVLGRAHRAVSRGPAAGRGHHPAVADGRERARDLLSQAVTAAVDATAMEDAGGWVTAVVPIESLPHAQAAFLGLGAEVEVLPAASLRARMADAAAGMARLYASS